jgi:ComF family protein
MFKKLLKSFINLLFPIYCFICTSKIDDDEYGGICIDCWERVGEINEPFSEACFEPEGIVLEGKRKRRPLQKVFITGIYEEMIRDIIHLYKYNKKEQLVTPLAELIRKVLEKNDIDKSYILVPVPLHRRRKKQRGFNQAELLTRYLKEKYNYQTEENNLIRKVNTPSQISLGREERFENLIGAFDVNYPEEIKGQKFLLVDDVYTTGSTLNLCAEELIRHGAKEVMGVVIAKTVNAD